MPLWRKSAILFPEVAMACTLYYRSSNQEEDIRMNIIKNKKLVNSFGRYIDLANTLGGGVSMARVQVLKKKNRLEVQVQVPSVNADALQVVVDYNKLFIYGVLPATTEKNTGEPVYSLPLFSQVLPIPFEVEVATIEATYKDGLLKVVLPYDAGRCLQKQNIRIEKR